jgi:hypothetical protein
VGSNRRKEGVDRWMAEGSGFYACLGVSCCLRSSPTIRTIKRERNWLVRCVEDAPTKREPEVKRFDTVISENKGTIGYTVLEVGFARFLPPWWPTEW